MQDLTIVQICLLILTVIVLLVYMYYVCLTYGYTHLHTYMSILQKNTIKLKTKHKIVFYYSHDYEVLPEYTKYSIDMTRQYCAKHGYELIIKDHSIRKLVSSYWLRVFDLINLMRIYPNDTIFVYLDLDTMINPKYFHIEIESLLNAIDYHDNQLYSIYIGRDENIWNMVNTGVFFVRNNIFAKSIIYQWAKQYNPNAWSLQQQKWICITETQKKCIWAQDEYEQGEFTALYMRNTLNAKKHVKVLHHSICSNKYLQLDSFIYHFMGLKENIQRYKYLHDQL